VELHLRGLRVGLAVVVDGLAEEIFLRW